MLEELSDTLTARSGTDALGKPPQIEASTYCSQISICLGMLGAMAIGLVITYAVTHWLWLVVHQGLH